LRLAELMHKEFDFDELKVQLIFGNIDIQRQQNMRYFKQI